MKGVLESDTDPLVLHEWNGDPMADESWTSRRHTPSVATAGSLPDYYEVLQVSPNADVEIIQAAHKRLLEKWLSTEGPVTPPRLSG